MARLLPELLAAGIPRKARRDTNDSAPRAGFAWSMFQRTVLRGGFGVAYEQALGLPGFVTYPQQIQVAVSAPSTHGLFPSIPAFLPGEPQLLPHVLDFVNPSPDAKNATTHFYSVAVQQEFGGSFFAEAGYLGNRAYHLFRFNERNPFRAGARLNPAWAARGIWETGASSVYNAAYLRLERRLAQGLMYGLNYTWSASTDDGQGPPQDTRDYSREHARSSIDRPQRLVAHFLWTLPQPATGRGPWMHALGEWQIAGVRRMAIGRALYRHHRSR